MKVTLLDHMGSDLTVVNAARVSFGKTSDWEYNQIGPAKCLGVKDRRLVQFLARGCTTGEWDKLKYDGMEVWTGAEMEEILNYVKRMPTHWTPFGHCQITLHLKVPIFVARQIMKHQVGFVVNEVSRRYVDEIPEFYQPDVWRARAENVKQGSSEEAVLEKWDDLAVQYLYDAHSTYSSMLKAGVCPEQARMVLPQSMFTEFWMTGSLYGWANLYNQRSDSHAQKETQEVARQVKDIIRHLYPVSWDALTQ